MNIGRSTRAYEAWLGQQLKGRLVRADLKEKHARMREGAFPFLRATYWRWAETILEVCPDLAKAPPVLAIGDIHLENFGTWRDHEGRLVWGVNDFDEAAEMPYLIDLVRLATSAVLGRTKRSTGADEICDAILDGYRQGADAPRAFVLDLHHRWMREAFEVPRRVRDKFWDKMDPDKQRQGRPPAAFAKALNAGRPSPEIRLVYWARSAGTGSLGRPRWIGYGEWRSAPVIREAKALVPSAWTLRPDERIRPPRCLEIARGAYSAPDPWYDLVGTILVRRLSPNNRKLELDAVGDVSMLLAPRMLRAMGHDVAALHLGTGRRAAVLGHVGKLKRRRFRNWVEAAATAVTSDQEAWR